MRGEIQLGGILNQEHGRVSCQGGAGLLPMQAQERRKGYVGYVRRVQQPIQRFDCFPGVVLWGQGGRWIAHQGASGGDRAAGATPIATPIAQLRLPTCLLGPRYWVQQGGCLHVAMLTSCQLWGRIRLQSRGFLAKIL
jgi:hypothetical protein